MNTTTNTITFVLSGIVLILVGVIAYMGFSQFSDTKQTNMVVMEESKEDPIQLQLRDDEIVLDDLKAGDYITSPLLFSGQAHQSWFVDGTFPVRLEDAEGNVIAEGFARTEVDTVDTDEYVSYTAELTFADPSSDVGILTLEKSNPENLPDGGYSYGISVTFVEFNEEGDGELGIQESSVEESLSE